MRILIVCGAGASSTFVAQRLRRAASDAGLEWDAVAGVESSVFPGAQDALLVGPHLADRVDALRASAGVPVALLPADIFADRDGERTLALVRALLAAENTPKGTP